MTEPTPNLVTVTVKPNGPLLVMGPITLTDPTGKLVTLPAGKAVALCRCGQSRNKPVCDMSHEEAGFCSNPPEIERDRLEAETPAAFTPNPKVPDPQSATD